MSDNKIKCTFRLSEAAHTFIVNECKKRNISQADVIDDLIKHYEKSRYLNAIEDTVAKNQKTLVYIDKEVQIMSAMLNMMCFNLNCKHSFKQPTEIYSAAKNIVNEKIRKSRLNKSDQLY